MKYDEDKMYSLVSFTVRWPDGHWKTVCVHDNTLAEAKAQLRLWMDKDVAEGLVPSGWELADVQCFNQPLW